VSSSGFSPAICYAGVSRFEFAPATWNFFRPLPPLLRLNFPLALAIDIPKTYDRNAAIDALEGIIQAYQVHLAGASGEDSRSVQRAGGLDDYGWRGGF
jgi:hypothetical protein